MTDVAPGGGISAAERRRAEAWPAMVLLVALTAMAPLSIDMFLPSMPTISDEFGAEKATLQLAVTLFIICFAGSQLFYGPFSDRHGRRPTLVIGICLFVVGSLVALTAQSVGMLLAGRVLQGLGGGAGPAIGQAIVLDIYGRERAGKVIAYMAIALPLAPAVAPIIGGFLHDAWGWHAVFVTLAVLGTVLLTAYLALLPETNRREAGAGRGSNGLLADYRTLLSNRTFSTYALIMGLMFGGQLVFISSSSFVLIDELGLSARLYGLSFGFVAIGIMGGATLSARLVRRGWTHQAVLSGVTTAATAATVLAVLAWLGVHHVAAVLLPMFVVALGLGMTRAPAMASALVPFTTMAGLASATLGFSQMLIASSYNITYSRFVEASTTALATGVFLSIAASLLVVLVLRPGRSMPAATVATAVPVAEAER
ncbi:MAG: multidrug effflux MFS transporter [Dehalococcoidia bacterium]|nr:multidrug effflux MFS transporter [Dehalococcoidia bacterium]